MTTTLMRAGDTLSPLFQLLGKHFYKPDLQAIRIVMGTMAAFFLDVGDPAWLFALAPPGSGKTSMSIMTAADLPNVIALGDVTENTFLSGFHGHHSPGLLEKLGPVEEHERTYTTKGNGLIIVKDFTTVLSMRREKRAAILSQLREIHDGQFRRDFGTGVTKIWKGRIGVIAAVTPVLDRHYGVFSTLGERFLQVRWHRPDSEEAGEWAIRQQGEEVDIQREARETVKALFKDISTSAAPKISIEMRQRIAAIAEIAALGRTHIFREGRNRDIEYVPEPEANTRIAKGLAAAGRGIAALLRKAEVGEQEFQDLVRVAFDSLPDNRRKVFLAIMRGKSLSDLGLADTVKRRELEDLEALGLVKAGESEPVLTERVRKLLQKAELLERNEEVRFAA